MKKKNKILLASLLLPIALVVATVSASCAKSTEDNNTNNPNNQQPTPKPEQPQPIDISTCTVNNTTKVYDNKIFSLSTIEVFYNNKKLALHTDYIINKKNNQPNIVDVGNYEVEIVGMNQYTGTKLVQISITKATNQIIEFKINNNKPYAKAKFGKPYFKYSNDKSFSNPIEIEPTSPGTYYTKAFVDATNNYDAVESSNILSFTINPIPPVVDKNIEFKQESTYNFGDPNLIVSDATFDFPDWFKTKIIEHRNDIFNFSDQAFYNEKYFTDNLQIKDYKKDFKSQTISGLVELSKPDTQLINKTITFNGFKDINILMDEQINEFNQKLNEIQLKKTIFTQDEINNINNDNFLGLVLQTLPFNVDFCEPTIIDLSKINNQFTFRVKLSFIEDNSYNKISQTISLAYQINNPTPVPPTTGIDTAVNYLNSINLEIDPAKMPSNGFIWLNNSIYNTDNGIYYKLKDFDLNQFEKQYNVRIRSGNKFNLDAVNYTLTFNMTIYKDSVEKQTKDFVINYVPLDKNIGTIDKLPTDNSVIVSNSMKNKLEITNILQNNRELNNNIKSINSNLTIKVREYMYQIRFLFYQMFSDNAVSIDYGIVSNNNNKLSLVLKAKIKDTVSISPYLQLNNTEINNTTFNTNDIVTIQYDIHNLNEEVVKLQSADSILPGLDGGMSLSSGNKQQVVAGLRKDLSLIKMPSVNINISKNNQSIYNQSNIINRFFLFSFLSKIK